MSVGVITHLRNATFDETRQLAIAAEAAGADWLGVPDAFWWRDGWVLLAEAARVTSRIQLGPMVTNPYLRHPFHTLAAMATLQDLAGPRIFLGLGAGGSEVTGVAGISRADAPERIEALADLFRRVVAGAPLDGVQSRPLEVPLSAAPILVAGRSTGVLRTAGRVGDRVLLWAIPSSELPHAAALVREGVASRRPTAGADAGAPDATDRTDVAATPEVIWAPLVRHDEASLHHVRNIAAYSVLNSRPAVHVRWGLAGDRVAEIRARLVTGGAAAAAELIPPVALDDLLFADPSPYALAPIGRAAGATSVALPAFDIERLGERVQWARQLEAALRSSSGSPGAGGPDGRDGGRA